MRNIFIFGILFDIGIIIIITPIYRCIFSELIHSYHFHSGIRLSLDLLCYPGLIVRKSCALTSIITW